MTAGIYEIVNLESGKSYIGSTQDIRKRWNGHRSALRRGIHRNAYLQSAWNKCGEDAFRFVVLEQIDVLDTLVEREQIWLDVRRAGGDIYNLAPVAGSTRGYRHTEEARANMRAAHSNPPPVSEETRRRISESGKGRKHSESTRRKMSDAATRTYPVFVNVRTGEHFGPGRNLQKACEERGLSKGSMCAVKNGRRPAYKGWMRKDVWETLWDESLGIVRDKRARDYPAFANLVTGEVIPAGWNVLKMCQDHGLGLGIYDVINGKSEYFKEWALASRVDDLIGEQQGGVKRMPRLMYPAFVNSLTEETIPCGWNLSEMCRRRGFSQSGMSQVVSGKRRSYRGWVLLEGRD